MPTKIDSDTGVLSAFNNKDLPVFFSMNKASPFKVQMLAVGVGTNNITICLDAVAL